MRWHSRSASLAQILAVAEFEHQHVVPKSYLRAFCGDDRQFWVMKPPYEKMRRLGPGAVMKKRYYYSKRWLPDREQQHELEMFFAQHVDHLPPLLVRFASGQPVTDDEANLCAGYMAAQFGRVPAQLEAGADMWAKARAADGKQTSDQQRVADRHTALEHYAETTYETFRKMRWTVVEAPADYGFLTSDNPVHAYNRFEFPPLLAGIGHRASQVHFPVSSSYAFCLLHENALIESDPLLVDLASLKPSTPRIAAHVLLDREQVRTFNLITVGYTHETLVGRDKDAFVEANQLRAQMARRYPRGGTVDEYAAKVRSELLALGLTETAERRATREKWASEGGLDRPPT